MSDFDDDDNDSVFSDGGDDLSAELDDDFDENDFDDDFDEDFENSLDQEMNDDLDHELDPTEPCEIEGVLSIDGADDEDAEEVVDDD